MLFLEAILTNTQNLWFIKKTVQKRSVIDALDGPISSFYNSKFDLTAKCLVTNSVVIMRVLCIILVSVYGRSYVIFLLFLIVHIYVGLLLFHGH